MTEEIEKSTMLWLKLLLLQKAFLNSWEALSFRDACDSSEGKKHNKQKSETKYSRFEYAKKSLILKLHKYHL